VAVGHTAAIARVVACLPGTSRRRKAPFAITLGPADSNLAVLEKLSFGLCLAGLCYHAGGKGQWRPENPHPPSAAWLIC
jgi:hypothetical protein